LNIRNEYPKTELNENDRKILDKYTKLIIDQIESRKVRAGILNDEKFNRKG
jgi:hypothetical protein